MGWAGGIASGSVHPLGGAVYRDRVQDPDFAPRTSEMAVFFVAYWYPIAHNCPHLPMHTVILATVPTFWHQGLVSQKTIFPWTGTGLQFQDDSSALHLLYAFISVIITL